MELGRFLRLAVNLAAGLGNLHRRGLIYEDIRPTHILVDLETNKVWFTGFGISSRLARERQTAESPEVIAGTQEKKALSAGLFRESTTAFQ